MNNLPIWMGMWSATNQDSSGAELTTFESAVIWILIALTTLATLVLGYMAMKDYI